MTETSNNTDLAVLHARISALEAAFDRLVENQRLSHDIATANSDLILKGIIGIAGRVESIQQVVAAQTDCLIGTRHRLEDRIDQLGERLLAAELPPLFLPKQQDDGVANG